LELPHSNQLGDDSFGRTHIEALERENINTSQISITADALSGYAQIIVEDSGQNCVVTVSGANDLLTPEDVQKSRDVLSKAKVMLCEIQIPRKTALAGMRLANELGVKTVFTAAPAVPDLEPEFFSLSDVFCVNETEAELLTGLPVTSTDTAMAAARQLIEKGCKNWVVITLGSEGAVFLGRNDPSKATLVPAPKVQALDTTGAGDCFLGALAYFMAYHPDWSMEKMIEKSCIIASASVQKSGTQPSFPSRDQLDDNIFN